jgi:hypothetical protein
MQSEYLFLWQNDTRGVSKMCVNFNLLNEMFFLFEFVTKKCYKLI